VFTWLPVRSGKSALPCIENFTAKLDSASSTLLQSKRVHHIYLPFVYNSMWLRLEELDNQCVMHLLSFTVFPLVCSIQRWKVIGSFHGRITLRIGRFLTINCQIWRNTARLQRTYNCLSHAGIFFISVHGEYNCEKQKVAMFYFRILSSHSLKDGYTTKIISHERNQLLPKGFYCSLNLSNSNYL